MKKIIASFLSMIMLLSALVPLSAVAVAGEATITVQSVTGAPGEMVEVPLVIENNPGILGATIQIAYDAGLTLVDGVSGDAFSVLTMTKPGRYVSPCNFTWNEVDILPDDIKDGTILTLRFHIDEDAESGAEYRVRVNCDEDSIFDRDLNSIDVATINGSVKVVDYTPGDVNGDEKINSKDVILLSRFIVGGYDVAINEPAGDVDANGKHNSKDVILICRFIAGGYDVELLPSPLGRTKPKCDHVMTAVEAKAATCTEDGNIAYWHCEKCDKYFTDAEGKNEIGKDYITVKATGHTIVIDEAAAPTYESEGLTEGAHCSVCGTVLIEREEIPKLKKTEYEIIYHIADNDPYLMSLGIENPNPSVYAKEDGLVLKDITVQGYKFLGWFTSGGTLVTEIQAGEIGEKELYAHWESESYTIQFHCEMVPVDKITYYAGQEVALPRPSLDKYTFVGWSDANYKMYDVMPAGTIGNLVLYANWSSDRNKAVAKSKLSDPIVCEDSDDGLIMFTYDLGTVENVPLFTVSDILAADGLKTIVTTSTSGKVVDTSAKTINETLSKAATSSNTWSLSSDWNSTTEVYKDETKEHSEHWEQEERNAKTSSGTYSVGYSSGGIDTSTSTSGGTYAFSKNDSHNRSYATDDLDSTVLTTDHHVSASVDASVPIKMVKVDAHVGYDYDRNKVTSQSSNLKTSGTDDWSNSENGSSYVSNASTSSKSWNSTTGFTSSNSTSQETAVREAVSDMVGETWHYGESYSNGGSQVESRQFASTDMSTEEFGSTTTYTTEELEVRSTTYETTGHTHGSYRIVEVGTFHVLGTVVYDIANSEYYIYTYNVMGDGSVGDEPKLYLDYSYDGTFDDYQTSVIPFEIPYYVNDYVNNRITRTEGLKIDEETGIVERYTDAGDTEAVYIPSYVSSDTGDGEFECVKVTGIKEGLFMDNTNIKTVSLSRFITHIPDNAFNGCSSLKYVNAPGVTSIGANAFAGCTSLTAFTASESIESLGDNAFENAPSLTVKASSNEVAQAAASSGARNIVLDISTIPSRNASGIELEVGEIESFELQGRDKEYKGLSLKSDAETTVINGITFTENSRIPMELSSGSVTLNRVTVDCSGYAMVLKADTTSLLLNRSVNLITNSGNAIISRNVDLGELSNDVVGKINVTGNWLVCGEVNDNGLLTFNEGEMIYLTEEEYENYLTSHYINFDANAEDAYVGTASKLAAMNMPIGELPNPSRDYYQFEGWYTEPEDGDGDGDGAGDLVTDETLMTSLTDITLYAHWIHNDAKWALASEVPEDAEIVNQKWTYDLTSYTSSNSSTLSGWNKYDTTWAWGPWGNWSDWSETNPGESESRQREWQQGSQYIRNVYIVHEYHYYAWTTRYNYCYTTQSYAAKQGNGTPYLNEIWIDYQLPYIKTSGGMAYYGPGPAGNYGTTSYFKADGTAGGLSPFERDREVDASYTRYYDLWRYRDRSKVYTYYFKKTQTDKESTSYPSYALLSSVAESSHPNGDYMSNVQEYVQYRTK